MLLRLINSSGERIRVRNVLPTITNGTKRVNQINNTLVYPEYTQKDASACKLRGPRCAQYFHASGPAPVLTHSHCICGAQLASVCVRIYI